MARDAAQLSTISLKVSNRWGDDSNAEVELRLQSCKRLSIFSVAPSSGPISGGTLIRISRLGGDSGVSILLARGEVALEVPCSSAQETGLWECTMPDMTRALSYRTESKAAAEWTGRWTLIARTGSAESDRDWRASHAPVGLGAAFEVYVQPIIQGLKPAAGYVGHGAVITVRGSGFEDGALLQCRFAGSEAWEASARWQSSSLMSCMAPSGMAQGVFTLEVSNNGADFTSDGVAITFEQAPTLWTMNPSRVTARSASVVTLIGTRIADRRTMFARVGGSVEVLRPLAGSSSTALCTVPALQAGNYTVELSSNGIDFITTKVGVRAVPVPSIYMAIPSMGPPSGGTNVTIAHSPVEASEPLACVFGGVSSPAHRLSRTSLYCESPPTEPSSSMAGELMLSVVYLDDCASSGHAYVPFWYRQAGVIAAVRPSSGGASGGTLLEVSARSVLESVAGEGEWRCGFGSCDVKNTSAAALVRSDGDSGVWRCSAVAGVPGSVVSLLICTRGLSVARGEAAYAYIAAGPALQGLLPSQGPAEAGHALTIFGHDFLSSQSRQTAATILLGGTAVEGTILSSSEIVCFVGAHRPGNMSVEVSFDGLGTVVDGLRYTTVDSAVQSISALPSRGPIRGGTHVVLTSGSALFAGCGGGVFCVFGGDGIVPGRILDLWHVACRSPSFASSLSTLGTEAGSVLKVDLVASCGLKRGGWLIAKSLGFELHEPAMEDETVLDAVFPSVGLAGAATSVSMIGSSFTAQAVCCLGDSSMPADTIFVASTLLRCNVPAKDVGEHLLHVSTSFCLDRASSGMPFSVVPAVSALRIYPVSVMEAQEALITVVGSGFVQSRELSCRFGSSGIVQASLVSPSMLTCTVPSGQPRDLTVHVTNDGIHYSEAGLGISVIPRVRVTSAEPSAGPASGGTLVVVRTNAPVDSAIRGCIFGSTLVHAEAVTESSVRCRSPNLAAGETVISITLVDGSELGSVAYLAVELPRVAALIPDHGSAEGGTEITVVGTGFSDRVLPIFFGHKAVSGSVEVASSSKILCHSPAHDPGRVQIRFSANHGEAETPDSIFTYVAVLAVTGLNPSRGPALGGTPIRITGIDLPKPASLACMFGGAERAAAVWHTSTSLECLSMPHRAGRVSLVLTNDGIECRARSFMFLYVEGAEVRELNPRAGLCGGGALVTIHGSGFEPSDNAVQCLVGPKVVQATCLSTAMIVCRTPALAEGLHQVLLLRQGAVVAGPALDFESFAAPSILQVIPSAGPTLGGTLVTVLASSGLVRDVYECRFGAADTEARLWSSSALHCYAPALSAGAVSLSIVVGGDEVSEGWSRFQYDTPAEVSSADPALVHASWSGELSITGQWFQNVQTLACTAAQPQYLAAYPYALGAPLTYTYTPQVTKLVPKEVEVPVKTLEYAVKETGCKNVFGFNVPCLTEGQARRRRSPDEETPAAAPAAPAVAPVVAGLPFSYGALPFAAYPYAAYPYAQVKVAEPQVTEVEVPYYAYKQVVEKVELQPLCHNGLGFAVPCA